MTPARPTKLVESDDLDRYVSTLTDAEREELAAAEAAVDLAVLLHRARERRHLTQAAAAERSGFAQQGISRFERPGANVQLHTLNRYLNALGYDLELAIRDHESGEYAGHVVISGRHQSVKAK